MNYKNSKEGRSIAAKYSDILPLSRPKPSVHHPRMPVANRAKIFSPFAALRGYEKEIAEEKWKKAPVPKKLLSDKDAGALSDLLLLVKKEIRGTIRYFKGDSLHPASPSLGTYEKLSGTIIRIDPVFRQLCISSGSTENVTDFDVLNELSCEGIIGVEDFLGIEKFPKE